MRSGDLRHYQSLALTVASRSVMRHHVGCILVDARRNEHVATFNRWLGDPTGRGWSLHAEVWGLLRAEEYGMRPTVALVARSNGRMARPCLWCWEALRHAGVKEVHFTEMSPGGCASERIG